MPGSTKIQRRRYADHEFSVVWDQERARFDIYRDRARIAAFARDRSTAIGLATREAKLEVERTGRVVIVTSTRDGQRIVEWDR